MSIKLMNMVFDRYPNGGGEMLLALAMADHAHDDGTSIFPSVEYLAKKTRQSERSVQYQLRDMEKTTWLLLKNSGNGGRNQHREYAINPVWIKGADFAPLEKGAIHDTKGAIHDSKGCNGLHPHITVINHQEPEAPKPKKTVAEKITGTKPENRATRLSESWVMPDHFKTWAATELKWSAEQIERLGIIFRNHHDGEGTEKANWLPVWKNWCLKEKATQAASAPPVVVILPIEQQCPSVAGEKGKNRPAAFDDTKKALRRRAIEVQHGGIAAQP